MKKIILSLLLTGFSLLSGATCSSYNNTNVSCSGGCNGTVTFTALSGNAPYYLNFNSATDTFTTSFQAGNLCAGTYIYTLIDSASACFDSGSIVITAPSPLAAIANVNNVYCSGNSGSIQIITTGGTPPYQYLINGAPGNVQGSFTNLSPGNYSFTVADANGCTTTLSATINVYPPVTLSVTTVMPSCPSCSDGSISVYASGGTAPYTFFWNTGSTNWNNIQLSVGTYMVCVTDANGCSTCQSIALYDSSYYPVSGLVYYDLNTNGMHDTLELALPNMQVQFLPDSCTIFAINGSYLNYLQAGSYTDSLIIPNGWHFTGPSSYNFNISNAGIDHLDFGIYPDSTVPANVTVGIAAPFPRCLTTRAYGIYISNGGPYMAQGIVAFTADSSMGYAGASPLPDSVVGNTYYWSYSNLSFYSSVNLAYIAFNIPGAGTIMHLSGINYAMDALGQITDTTTYLLTQIVSCSYDPNDKSVNPPGINATHDVTPETPLDFTIRFQNTGNDTAYAVVIKDTIDANLDLSTLQFQYASHDYAASVDNYHVLTITFNNIMLPDSNADEPSSHGFVQYHIAPLPNLPDPTAITNTAYIYFDQNPAVATNTTSSNYTALTTCINQPITSLHLITYPNPVTQDFILQLPDELSTGCRIKMTDNTGRLVKDFGFLTGKHIQLSKGNLATGNYLLEAIDSNAKHIAISKVVVR